MLNDLEKNIAALEKNLIVFARVNDEILLKNKELSLKNEELHNKNKLANKNIEHLKQENSKLKLSLAISGNADYNRLMKLHIARLVKEIDSCIVELQNLGL